MKTVETVVGAGEAALEVIADRMALVIEEAGEVLLVVEIHSAEEMLPDVRSVVTDSQAEEMLLDVRLGATDNQADSVATGQAGSAATSDQAGMKAPLTGALAVERGGAHSSGDSRECVQGNFFRLLRPPPLPHASEHDYRSTPGETGRGVSHLFLSQQQQLVVSILLHVLYIHLARLSPTISNSRLHMSHPRRYLYLPRSISVVYQCI